MSGIDSKFDRLYDHERELQLKRDAASELYEACVWAEAALAPFSKNPAEKSGISNLRAAIAKARGDA